LGFSAVIPFFSSSLKIQPKSSQNSLISLFSSYAKTNGQRRLVLDLQYVVKIIHMTHPTFYEHDLFMDTRQMARELGIRLKKETIATLLFKIHSIVTDPSHDDWPDEMES
jgi:hypothetical protein